MKKLLLIGLLQVSWLFSAMSVDTKDAKKASAVADEKGAVWIIEEPLYITQTKTVPDEKESIKEIRFGEKGALIIQPGRSLSLHNVVVRGVNNNNLRLADRTSTLVLVDSTLVFNDDYDFFIGSLLVAGNCRFERDCGAKAESLFVHLDPAFTLFMGLGNKLMCGDNISTGSARPDNGS